MNTINTNENTTGRKRKTVISGGTVITATEVLHDHDVIIEGNRIANIIPTVASSTSGIAPYDENTEVIDARGTYVSPGFIDIHADYIEKIASPRPSVVMDLECALYESERELVAHGVTTMFHSLSVYRNRVFDESPIRDFENVTKLLHLVSCMEDGAGHLIRHRMHARLELDVVNRMDEVLEFLDGDKIDLISFMDHTPGQGQYSDIELFAKTLKGYRDLSDDEISKIVLKQQTADKLSVADLTVLARAAAAKGIAVASHDDDTVEKLDVVSEIGASISEFPISLDVAKAAQEKGMHTVAGAPNVLLGHSHSGNLSAREAVMENAIDVLCSDYYPAALIHAVFQLHYECGLDLAEAFALVTINPAKAARIDDELGEITPGKRADILIIRELPHTLPVVERALVDGRIVFQADYPVFAADHQANRQANVQAEEAPLQVEAGSLKATEGK